MARVRRGTGAWMRPGAEAIRVITIVALALSLAGCEAGPPLPAEPFELAHSREPADGRHGGCSLGWWTGGRLVVNGIRGTSIIVEAGDFGTPGATLPVVNGPAST